MYNSVNKLLKIIDDKIDYRIVHKHDMSLFNGICGEILMYYEMYILYSNTKYKYKCDKLLDELLLSINKCHYSNFALGYAGIFYTLNYLNNEHFIDYEDNQASILDEHFSNVLKQMCYDNNYDLLEGIIGIGIYYIERSKKSNIHSVFVYNIINYILSLCIERDKEAFWYHNADCKSNKSTFVSLGFLHGMPSIISFLLICYKEGYRTNRMTELIDKGLLFLTNRMSNHEFCSFPNIINTKEKYNLLINNNTILGYCYGDMGIAHLYLHASQVLHNEDYNIIANNIASKTYTRARDIRKMSDPFFCHGLSSVIYFTHQFETNFNNNLESEILEYLIESLERDFINSKTNYYSQGILSGINGVVLSLISTIKATSFERILLLR